MLTTATNIPQSNRMYTARNSTPNCISPEMKWNITGEPIKLGARQHSMTHPHRYSDAWAFLHNIESPFKRDASLHNRCFIEQPAD